MAPFVTPLFTLMQAAVTWNDSGNGFIIRNIKAFEHRVLATYYKHRQVAPNCAPPLTAAARPPAGASFD